MKVSGKAYGVDAARAEQIYADVFKDLRLTLEKPPEYQPAEEIGGVGPKVVMDIPIKDLDDAFAYAIPRAQDQLRALTRYESMDGAAKGAPSRRPTVVVNIFGGPGAGKTTAALEVTEKLKKAGYIVEYAPEYAKELVWEINNPAATRAEREAAAEKLNGSYDNQRRVYAEQLKRIQRCVGQCDFVVTDSPSLLSVAYLKENDPEKRAVFEETALRDFGEMSNFNMVVKRAGAYEQAGRVQDAEQAKDIDESVTAFLEEHEIYHGTYSHEQIGKSIENMQKTLARVTRESRKADKAGTPGESLFPHPSQFEVRKRENGLPGEVYEAYRSGEEKTFEVRIEHDPEIGCYAMTAYIDDGKLGRPQDTACYTSIHSDFQTAYKRAYERVTGEVGPMAIAPRKGNARLTIDEVVRHSERHGPATLHDAERRQTAVQAASTGNCERSRPVSR